MESVPAHGQAVAGPKGMYRISRRWWRMGWRRRMQTYPAARAALRLIHTDPALAETKVRETRAAASRWLVG
jgi:hypothetical protein